MLIWVDFKFIMVTVFCIPLVLCLNENYVLTRFKGLEKYFKRTMKKLNFRVNQDDQLRMWNPLNMCNKLFGSRGYQVKGETSSSGVGCRNATEMSHHHVTDEQMRNIEHWNEHHQYIQRNQIFPLSRWKYTEADAFICYDLNLTERWKIILHEDNYSGFLFKILANSQKLTLEALIDVYYVVPVVQNLYGEPDEYLLGYYTNNQNIGSKKDRQWLLEKQFHDSVAKLVREARDPLCSLNKVLRFRLCSMGADALFKTTGEQYKYTFYRKGEDDYLFEMPFENFYHHKKNPDSACPKITIDFKDEMFINGIEHRALFCDVTIQNNVYQFYLSYDIKSEIGMFIISKKEGRFIIKTLLEVQLFYRLRMNDFDVIYSDEILKKFEEAIIS